MTRKETILARYIQSISFHERNGLSGIPCNEKYALKIAQSFLREKSGSFIPKGGTKTATRDAIFYLDGLCVVRWHLCDSKGEILMHQIINLETEQISTAYNGFQECGEMLPENEKVTCILDYFENK